MEGEPMSYVTVKSTDNNKMATVTDADGKFSLKFDRGKGVKLVFDYIGMKTAHYFQLPYTDQGGVVIHMEEDTAALMKWWSRVIRCSTNVVSPLQ